MPPCLSHHPSYTALSPPDALKKAEPSLEEATLGFLPTNPNPKPKPKP